MRPHGESLVRFDPLIAPLNPRVVGVQDEWLTVFNLCSDQCWQTIRRAPVILMHHFIICGIFLHTLIFH
jgi:hypothetical protein